MRNLESIEIYFWFPNDQENPADGKSIDKFKTKCLFQFDEAKYACRIKYTNDKLDRNYVSLSDHPPKIDKKPLVGGESILRGNVSGMNLKMKSKKKN